MKLIFLLSFVLVSCAGSAPRRSGPRYRETFRCTSILEAYANDENMEAIKVLLKEGEVEIQRETDQGMYLSFAHPDRSKAEYMVTYYLADRLGERYIANLLNCFNKNEKVKTKRKRVH